MDVTQVADRLLAAGTKSDEIAARLAASASGDKGRTHAPFRGLIDARMPITRRQWTRLRRLGFVPVMAGGQTNGGAPAAVVAMLPFTSSAHEHTEPAFTQTVTPGAAEVAINPQDIPASGYLRHLLLQVDAAGGAGGTLNADGPFNLLSGITMQEVNGSNIVGGAGFTGFDLFLANLLGGYVFKQDPREWPGYVASAPNPSFTLRIPAEVSQKDGLGALVNQNASALFKLLLSVATRAAVTSADWTTAPALTIRGWLEAWTLPAPTDSQGRPQSQMPPLVGSGQYWSKRTQAIMAGSNTVAITRLGNLLRNLVFVARDATGARADNVFPDPIQFSFDGNVLHNTNQRYWKQYLWEKVLTNQAALAGVFALSFSHITDGKMGNEDPNLWLGTTQASRLEINGNSAGAGSIHVLHNEVAPVEANPANQYVQQNATGTLLQPASVQAAR